MNDVDLIANKMLDRLPRELRAEVLHRDMLWPSPRVGLRADGILYQKLIETLVLHEPMHSLGKVSVNDYLYEVTRRKLFLVVGITNDIIIYTSLGGGTKKVGLWWGLSPESDMVSYEQVDTPVFYGKNAESRYRDYTDLMQHFGNTRYIKPFTQSRRMPERPVEPIPSSSAASCEDTDVLISHSATDGTTVEWRIHGNAGDEIKGIFRGEGFVWAPSAGQYRRTHSVGKVTTTAPLPRLVQAMHDLGHTVFLDLQESSIEEAKRAQSAHLRSKLAVWRDRVTNAENQRDSHHTASNVSSGRFAMGQPILVGHHSERSSLAARKRTHAHMSKSIEYEKKRKYAAGKVRMYERKLEELGL